MQAYFISRGSSGELDGERVFLIYKLLAYPSNLLVQKLQAMNLSNTLHHYYRKVAVMVHPDKNRHELAVKAFLKFKGIYEQVVSA